MERGYKGYAASMHCAPLWRCTYLDYQSEFSRVWDLARLQPPVSYSLYRTVAAYFFFLVFPSPWALSQDILCNDGATNKTLFYICCFVAYCYVIQSWMGRSERHQVWQQAVTKNNEVYKYGIRLVRNNVFGKWVYAPLFSPTRRFVRRDNTVRIR
jgi:hypothetical protein